MGGRLSKHYIQVPETRKHQRIVNEFERGSDRRGLKINVGENKALGVKKDQRGSCEKVRVSGGEEM